MRSIICMALLSVLIGMNISFGQVKTTNPQVNTFMFTKWMSPHIEVGTEKTDHARIFITNANKHAVKVEVNVINKHGKKALTLTQMINPSGMAFWTLDRADFDSHHFTGWIEVKANGKIYPSGYILLQEFKSSYQTDDQGAYSYLWNTSIPLTWYKADVK